MIYLVTACQELFTNEAYKIVSVEESLKLLEPLTTVGLDTETKGLDPHTGTLLTLQLGCFDFQIVIDCTTINILLYKDFLESERLFLFWNARFDLKWLFKYKIVPLFNTFPNISYNIRLKITIIYHFSIISYSASCSSYIYSMSMSSRFSLSKS